MKKTNIEKKPKKYLRVALTSILAILIAFISIFAIFFSGNLKMVSDEPLYESEQEVFNYFNSETYDDFLCNLDGYSEEIDSINKDLSQRDNSLIEDIQKAEEIPEKYKIIFDKANALIEDFFKEIYDLSVHEKLSKMQVKQVTFSNSQVPGLYYSVTNTLYISKNLIVPELIGNDEECATNTFYKLCSIYVHEAIHYLGIMFENDSLIYLMEGLTECLNEDILVYGGLNYENETLYIENKALARQLMIADKHFVIDLISAESISDEHLNNRIDSYSFPGMSLKINDAFKLLMHHPYNYEYKIISQHLIGEYCKNFVDELSEEEMLEIANNFIVPLNDII